MYNLVFVGNKTVTINANPMSLVHSTLYYIDLCTACIGCALIVPVIAPMKTKICLSIEQVLFCQQLYYKKSTITHVRSICYFLVNRLKPDCTNH